MKWNSELSYVIGLITTDGSLSKDGRHINLTSKDIDQLTTFSNILNLKNKIGMKKSSYSPANKCYQIQFGNIRLYKFLLSIGLTTNKTKTLGALKIPNKYFGDFLRGHLDGDGCTYSYWDKRWKKSFMFYTVFMSASIKHILWLQKRIAIQYGIEGKINPQRVYYQLRYAKRMSLILLGRMYHAENLPCLMRKRFKIKQALGIMNNQAEVLKLVDRLA